MTRLRFFRLIRDVDTFGISGTGHVATGCLVQDDALAADSTEGTVVFTFATSNMSQTTTITTVELVTKFQCAVVTDKYPDAAWHGKPSSRIVWFADNEPEPEMSWPRELLLQLNGPCVFKISYE